jgi:hypothetical protein
MRPVIVLVMLCAAVNAQAADCVFESGPQRTHLLELFTSEGCSSCPPAEAWLSKLKAEPRLWKDFVPIAFHVDYWDRLGWRDPFAAKEWTARQYQYSAVWKSDSVYTPGFVLDAGENNGRNLRQDFVVLSLANEKMVNGKAEVHLIVDSRAGAIAAWITAPNQLEPIQAVGGWLR